MKPALIRHLSGESLGRFPVWLMRQAGRYLPAYGPIRAKRSFWEMVTTPEIATQVSLLPLEVLDLDAVIFFSDILTLPYGLGIDIELKESVGPITHKPLTRQEQFEVFRDFDPEKHTPYVGATLRTIRRQLHQDKALLGFAGAPWTVACYLIEGQFNRQFHRVKHWLYSDPEGFAKALESLADATAAYLKYQISSGAHAIQLFDTWISEMPLPFFRHYYLPLMNRLLWKLETKETPTIYFLRHAAHLLGAISDLKVDVLSVDSLTPLDDMDWLTGGRFSLQGNLDPNILLTNEPTIRKQTWELVKTARKLSRPAILNLGHGIFRQTPVENVQVFVDEATQRWI